MPLAESVRIGQILRSPREFLIVNQFVTSDEKTGIALIDPGTRPAQASSKETPAMDVMISILIGFTPSWRI
jgi:hypothetical protein